MKQVQDCYKRVSLDYDLAEVCGAEKEQFLKKPSFPWGICEKPASSTNSSTLIGAKRERLWIHLNPDIPESSRDSTNRLKSDSYTLNAPADSAATSSGIHKLQTGSDNSCYLHWRLLDESTRLEIDVLNSRTIASYDDLAFRETYVLTTFHSMLPQVHFYEPDNGSESNEKAGSNSLYITVVTVEGEVYRHIFRDKTLLLNVAAPLRSFSYQLCERSGFLSVNATAKKPFIYSSFFGLSHVISVASDGGIVLATFFFEEVKREKLLSTLFVDGASESMPLVEGEGSFQGSGSSFLAYTSKPTISTLTTASSSDLGTAISQLSATKVLSAVSSIFSGGAPDDLDDTTKRYKPAFPQSLLPVALGNCLLLLALCDDLSVRVWSLPAYGRDTPVAMFPLSIFGVELAEEELLSRFNDGRLKSTRSLKLMPPSDEPTASGQDVSNSRNFSARLLLHLDGLKSVGESASEKSSPWRGLFSCRLELEQPQAGPIAIGLHPLTFAKLEVVDSRSTTCAFVDYQISQGKLFVIYGSNLYRSTHAFAFGETRKLEQKPLYLNLVDSSWNDFEPERDLDALASVTGHGIAEIFCRQLFIPGRFCISILKDAVDVYCVSLFGKLSVGSSREQLCSYLLSKLRQEYPDGTFRKLKADCVSIWHEVQSRVRVLGDPLALYADESMPFSVLLKRQGLDLVVKKEGRPACLITGSLRYLAAYLLVHFVTESGSSDLQLILDSISSQVACQAFLRRLEGLPFSDALESLKSFPVAQVFSTVRRRLEDERKFVAFPLGKCIAPLQTPEIEECFELVSVAFVASVYQEVYCKKRFESVCADHVTLWVNLAFAVTLNNAEWRTCFSFIDGPTGAIHKVISVPFAAHSKLSYDLSPIDLAKLVKAAFVSAQVSLLKGICRFASLYAVLLTAWKLPFLLGKACLHALSADSKKCHEAINDAMRLFGDSNEAALPGLYEALDAFFGPEHSKGTSTLDAAQFELAVLGIQMFEFCGSDELVVEYVQLALSVRPGTVLLQRKLIRGLLQVGHVDEALRVLRTLTTPGEIAPALLDVVTKLCENSMLEKFAKIEWQGLLDDVESVLWYKATRSRISSKSVGVNYYRILFRINLERQRWDKAASAMLALAFRWKEVLDLCLQNATDRDWSVLEAAGEFASSLLTCLSLLRGLSPSDDAVLLCQSKLCKRGTDLHQWGATLVESGSLLLARNFCNVGIADLELYYHTVIVQMKLYEAYGGACSDVFSCFEPLQLVVALLNAEMYSEVLDFAVLAREGLDKIIEVGVEHVLCGKGSSLLQRVLSTVKDDSHKLKAAECFLQTDEYTQIPVWISQPLMKSSPEDYVRLLLQYRTLLAAATFINHLTQSTNQAVVDKMKPSSERCARLFPLSLATQVCLEVEELDEKSLGWSLQERQYFMRVRTALQGAIQAAISDRLELASNFAPEPVNIEKALVVKDDNNNDIVVDDISESMSSSVSTRSATSSPSSVSGSSEASEDVILKIEGDIVI